MAKNNRYLFIFGLVLYFIFSGPAGLKAESGENYIALVVEIRGEVLVQRKDSLRFTEVTWGSYIYQGDLVKAGLESHVALLFSNGAMIELSENSQMQIKQHPGLDPNSATTDDNKNEKVVPELRRLRIQNMPFPKPRIVIAADGSHRLLPQRRITETDTFIISPRMSTVSTPTPKFKWSAPYPNLEYKIVITDSLGLTRSYRTTNPEWQCTDSLEWGKQYVWTLGIYQDFKRVYGPFSTKFRVISKARFSEYHKLLKKMKLLSSDKRSKNYYHLIMGFTYIKYYLIDKALTHFQILARENPATAFPHEALCRLYWDQQRFEKAQQEYDIWHNLLAKSKKTESQDN